MEHNFMKQGQNTSKAANLIEGDNSKDVMLKSTRFHSLGLTRDGFTSFLANLGSYVKEGEKDRIFHFSSGIHIWCLKVSSDGYEVCDTNIIGLTRFFPKGKEFKLSHFLNANINYNEALNIKRNEACDKFAPIFQICEFDLTEGNKQVSCLPEVIAKVMPEDKVPFNELNGYGFSATHLAARAGSLDDLTKMHESFTAPPKSISSKINITPQHYPVYGAMNAGVRCGDPKVVEFLLAHNYNPEEKDSNTRGSTPLINAIRYKEIDIIRQLLMIDAVDVNNTNNEGMTPLIAATDNGCIEAVKLLLEQKNIRLDIKAENKTALQWAQENEDYEIEYLITKRILQDQMMLLYEKNQMHRWNDGFWKDM